MQKQLMILLSAKKSLIWVLLFVFSCENKIHQPQKPFSANNFNARVFLAYNTTNVLPIGNFYLYIKDSQYVHHREWLPYIPYSDCGCLRKYELKNIKNFEYYQAYQDSQNIHQDTFLHHCENTDGLNQALINANISSTKYNKKEIAEILQRWDFAYKVHYQHANYIKSYPQAQINHKDIVAAINSNYQSLFINSTDSNFNLIHSNLLKIIPQFFSCLEKSNPTTAVFKNLETNYLKAINSMDTTTILILNYDEDYDAKQQLFGVYCDDLLNETTFGLVLNDMLQLQAYDKNNLLQPKPKCLRRLYLPSATLQYKVYDNNGFVQVKKKILDGYNQFLR